LSSTGARRVTIVAVPTFTVPPSDAPFDFRHQATEYARYRLDYSAALYDAIAARAGEGDGRRALDVGCGTGFVTRELRRRGWAATGVDFSGPMIAEARRIVGAPLLRARGEALPLGDGTAALLTCGTAFHWLAPAPALAEFRRVLVPGGWAALFWRYPGFGEFSVQLMRDVLRRFGTVLPDVPLVGHPPAPFSGSKLAPEPPAIIASTSESTVESFLGVAATVEFFRRLTGERHAEFLATVREELERRAPRGFSERQEEYLFLARRVD
jgi:SAM-dependent methyltransferase